MSEVTRTVFVSEILLAELIFLYPAPKRAHFILRFFSAILLSVLTAVCYPSVLFANSIIINDLFRFILLFSITVLAMSFSFNLRFEALFSDCVAGYAVEHIAFHIAKIIRLSTPLFIHTDSWFSFPRWELVEFIVFPPVYLVTLVTLGSFSAKHECYQKANLKFNSLSIGIIFICLGLTRAASFYGVGDSIVVSLYAITCCIMALIIQIVLYQTIDLQNENITLNLLRQEERKQFELSKKSIDTINIKYHDLKHLLAGLHGKLPDGEIASIQNALQNYGSQIKTGNEALDILLTENSLRYGDCGIVISFTGNGNDLSFMAITDVYSLFGNAIDNAVEAIQKLDVPEKKFVDIYTERKGEMIIIYISNYFSGKLSFDEGLPLTTKQEEIDFHGFGLRSIQTIAQKYGGSIKVSIDKEIFTLRITLFHA